MKKLSFLVGAIAISTAVFAQKPTGEDAKMSLEGQLNIYGADGLNVDWTAPAIRFRYFVKENIAARVTLGINSTNMTTTYNEFTNPLDPTLGSGKSGEYNMKSSFWNFNIGGEYHFAGTEKLSPYGGLDIMLGGGKDSDEGTEANPGGYQLGHTESSEQKVSMFGVGLVGGVDYYFAQNFYFGLELGWGFSTMTFKQGESTQTDVAGGVSVTTKGITDETKISGLSNGQAAFRLGWRF